MEFPFEQVTERIAQKEEAARKSLEETLVKRLLGHAAGGRPDRPVSVHREAVQAGFDRACFEWFYQRYPGFPIRLAVSRLRYVHQTGVPDLFGARFAKTKFFRVFADYMAANDLKPVKDRVGLVFGWPEIQPGGAAMVLHNYPPDLQRPGSPQFWTGGTKIVRPFGNPLVVYVIESFQDLMNWVGTEWCVD
jgi:hypothetical protein